VLELTINKTVPTLLKKYMDIVHTAAALLKMCQLIKDGRSSWSVPKHRTGSHRIASLCDVRLDDGVQSTLEVNDVIYRALSGACAVQRIQTSPGSTRGEA
jgi:hypothetical protein